MRERLPRTPEEKKAEVNCPAETSCGSSTMAVTECKLAATLGWAGHERVRELDRAVQASCQ